jgi:diacylglycerol kinase (ATP)
VSSGRWTVIVNPAAGTPGTVEARVIAALDAHGVDGDVVVSGSAGHLERIVADAVAQEHYRFAAVGGDGTAHLVVNALMRHRREGVRPTLAILPAGSGSDFIRTFALPRRLEDAVRHLVTPDVYTVDVGLLEGSFGSRWFLNAANVGVGAGSVEVADRLPRVLGRQRYTIGFWLALWRYSSRPVTVTLDGRVWEGQAITVVLANGQFFGGGMNIAPKALLADGELDVQIFSGPRRMAFSVMPRVKRGLHLRHPAVRRRSASTVEVVGPAEWPVEADGEIVGRGPVRVTTIPSAIDFKI